MNKRDEILKAALREFSTNDYESASVNKIIQNAGTSKGNFYHYFKNKEELYIVLMRKAWLKKMEAMDASPGKDFFDGIQKQMLAGIKFSRENPEYYNLSRKFANEKNKKIYNKVIAEIKNDSPTDFFNKFILLILNNINELIDEDEELESIEEKLDMVIKVLKKGFS